MDSIVITGTSTGIGEACLPLLLENYYVIALNRHTQSTDHPHLYHLNCDLNDSQSVSDAVAMISDISQTYPLRALINNAGYGQYGPLEELSRQIFTTQLETNLLGPFQLTVGLIPLLRHTQGRIVFISSVLGFTATPMRGLYCASKYALEAIADTLRLELHADHINTILIEPGPVKTAFRHTATKHLRTLLAQHPNTRYRHLYERFIQQTDDTPGTVSANTVAHVIMKALHTARPQHRYRICKQTHLAWLCKKILPSQLNDWIYLKYKA